MAVELTRSFIIGLIVVGGCLAVAALLLTRSVYRVFNPYLDREIAGPLVISDEWLEVSPQELLRPERQVQYLVLEMDDSVRASDFSEKGDPWGVVLQDGSIASLEAQIVDDDEKVYELNAPGFFVDPSGSRPLLRIFGRTGLPTDKTFRKVRIRSSSPVACKRILWRCFNHWDVK
jgi:hypothetical protein